MPPVDRLKTGFTLPRVRNSATLLVCVNLLPLAGVLFWNWDLYAVVALFWAENLVVGVLNFAAMGHVNRGSFGRGFFLVHYFLFCVVHGVFVDGLFGPNAGDKQASFNLPIFDILGSPTLLLGLVAIAASRLYSYRVNFIGGREFAKYSADAMMFRPYGRVVALHIAIIVAGVALKNAQSPLLGLVALVTLKMLCDLAAHLFVHGGVGRALALLSAAIVGIAGAIAFIAADQPQPADPAPGAPVAAAQPAQERPQPPPPPPEILSAWPSEIEIGKPARLQTTPLGPQAAYEVSIGGHGISVTTEVLRWDEDFVIVLVPPDPRFMLDKAYYFRIMVRDTYKSSNLLGFMFAKDGTPDRHPAGSPAETTPPAND